LHGEADATGSGPGSFRPQAVGGLPSSADCALIL
jgi:hypothetical protein